MSNSSHNYSKLICNSTVWDNNQFWWTSEPRLTDCFRQTVLITIGPIVMLLLTPYDFRYFICKVRPQSIPWRSRNVCSALLTLVLIAISFSHLIRSVWKDVLLWSTVFEPCVDFIGLSVAYYLQIIYRRNGRRISIALQIFWFITTLVAIIRLYLEHIFSDNSDGNGFHRIYLIIYCVYIFTSFVLFVLSFICDEPSHRYQLSLNRRTVGKELYCLLENESAFSRLTFFWIFRFLLKGFRQKLEFKDLPKICHKIKAKYVSKLYQKHDLDYNLKAINSLSHLHRKPKRIYPVLWSLCFRTVLFCHLLLVIYISALYVQPYLLSKILDFISEYDRFEWHGIVYSVGFAFATIISTISYQQINALMQLIAIQCKSALISAVYQKIFKLSPTSRVDYNSGEIINLISIDCNRVFQFIVLLMNLVIVPINVCIGLYYLWQYLGIASLGLMAVMVFVIPFNIYFGYRMDGMQKKQMTFKDKRLALISEILNSIKMIKLNAWELPFIQRVSSLRNTELNEQKKIAIIYAFIVLIWIMAPVLSASACFITYAVIDYSKFNLKTIFVSLSIMNILRNPMQLIPSLFSGLIRANISLNRLSKFLSSEELDVHYITRHKRDNINSICLENASFSYILEEVPVLQNLTFSIRRGTLTGIVGEVGSGKSSLLSAIIGELYKTNGNITVNGTVAYVPQTPWIQNMSLKSNIIFTSDEDENRYEEILNACAFLTDLSTLPNGDQTEIGEKGVNLSGGQRQRVSLARAVYQNSDIYLMDDPLASVDAHVGQHLFREVIGRKGLLRYKTRILCSHNLSYLMNCDQIFVLRDGEIVGHGSYEELTTLGLLSQITQLNHRLEDEVINEKSNNLLELSDETELIISQSIESSESDGQPVNESSIDSSLPSEPIDIKDEEPMNLGNVLWKDYYRYLSSIGFILFFMIPFFRFGSNGSEFALNYWLSLWSDSNNTVTDSDDRIFHLITYGSLLASEALFILLGNIVLFVATIKASKRLHFKALYGVMRSPLQFFNRVPIGRLLNRFSRDISTVDESIPDLIISLVDIFTLFIILYALVVYKLTYLSLGLLVIIAMFYLIYKFYLRTSRQMRRMESISNSPLQSHTYETIVGIDSIRAYNVLPQFIHESNKRIDLSLNCYYHRLSLSIWLRVWSQIIGSLITVMISVYIVLNYKQLTAGVSALLLVYSVEAVGSISYTIRLMANLETDMVSVERLNEFCDLSPEKEWKSSSDSEPPKEWPQNGCIEYKSYSTAYRIGLRPVLKNINLKIDSGEKVLIVGRTGAGKSSLMLSLLRIIEPISGRILVDGLDITRIGLHDLRSRFSFIPQEPFLFGDTLRRNLDPLDMYSGEELWTVLKECNLDEYVEKLPQKLDFNLTENGDNLSAGQKQLICLSRALLRKSKILVFDEPLSACDSETEKTIHNIINDKLKDSTVLLVSHRLNTIIDYDRVLVIHLGSVVENDSPKNLLLNKKSIFYCLAKDAKII